MNGFEKPRLLGGLGSHKFILVHLAVNWLREWGEKQALVFFFFFKSPLCFASLCFLDHLALGKQGLHL